MALGFLGAIMALASDVSVSDGTGGRVNNIGLIADRQNYLIVAGLMILVGVILIVADRTPAQPKKVAAEPLSYGIVEEDGLFVWGGTAFASREEAEAHVKQRLADHKAKSVASL